MKLIPMSNGQSIMVSDEDYDELSKYPWCPTTVKGYPMRYTRMKDVGFRKAVYMHRVIMASELSAGDRLEVDHIDGNPLNNQRSNLRACTRKENCRNVSLNSQSASGLKGVTWIHQQQNWRARIKLNGKHITLGRFPTAELAAAAYNEASKKYHGEFGRLNAIP